jgi:hypothetical protein
VLIVVGYDNRNVVHSSPGAAVGVGLGERSFALAGGAGLGGARGDLGRGEFVGGHGSVLCLVGGVEVFHPLAEESQGDCGKIFGFGFSGFDRADGGMSVWSLLADGCQRPSYDCVAEMSGSCPFGRGHETDIRTLAHELIGSDTSRLSISSDYAYDNYECVYACDEGPLFCHVFLNCRVHFASVLPVFLNCKLAFSCHNVGLT